MLLTTTIIIINKLSAKPNGIENEFLNIKWIQLEELELTLFSATAILAFIIFEQTTNFHINEIRFPADILPFSPAESPSSGVMLSQGELVHNSIDGTTWCNRQLEKLPTLKCLQVENYGNVKTFFMPLNLIMPQPGKVTFELRSCVLGKLLLKFWARKFDNPKRVCRVLFIQWNSIKLGQSLGLNR